MKSTIIAWLLVLGIVTCFFIGINNLTKGNDKHYSEHVCQVTTGNKDCK